MVQLVLVDGLHRTSSHFHVRIGGMYLVGESLRDFAKVLWLVLPCLRVVGAALGEVGYQRIHGRLVGFQLFGSPSVLAASLPAFLRAFAGASVLDNDRGLRPRTLRLEIFHFNISGNDDNDEQSRNIRHILLTLEVFHFDISGNDDNDEQS